MLIDHNDIRDIIIRICLLPMADVEKGDVREENAKIM
jgi:hypothetical protein